MKKTNFEIEILHVFVVEEKKEDDRMIPFNKYYQ